MHTKYQKRVLAQPFPDFCRHSLCSYQQKRLTGDASEQLQNALRGDPEQ